MCERTVKSGLSRRKKNDWNAKLIELLKEKDLELVTTLTHYISSTEIVEVRCEKHQYTFSTSVHRLRRAKYGCIYCAGARPKITREEVSRKLKSIKYKAVIPESVNLNTQVEVSCGTHPEYKTYVRNIFNGNRCPYCMKVKLEPLKVTKYLKELGYKILNSYDTVDSELKLECEEGHIWHTTLRSLKHDSGWCTQCKTPSKSKQEFVLINHIKKWDKDYKIYHNDRKILEGKELDIVVEDKKLAIEYNGLFYHSEVTKDSRYHYNKYKEAKDRGYSLVSIWDYEWVNNKRVILGRLKALLGNNKYRIGAREVKIKKVGKDRRTNAFLDKYHLQGKATHQHAYQLWYGKKLVSVMTFGKHHRGGKHLVLNRYCVKKDYTVMGGANKLFKAAVNDLKCDIVSYSDNRWSEGRIYENLGFSLVKELEPDYFYTDIRGSVVRSKQSMKKTDEEKLMNKTEKQLRNSQGYFRVYDCGKKKWIYKFKK